MLPSGEPKPMERIEASCRFRDPPKWAELERNLIDFLNNAADPIMENYIEPDGSLKWPPSDNYTGIDGHDDAYESFWNWPLFYTIGGDNRYLEFAQQEYEAILDQFAEIETPFGHPMVVEEYEQCRDWFHQGEGNLLFYFLCLADPTNQVNAERAKRFAGLYLPESNTGNYDPEKKIITAPMTGSMGPEYCELSEFTHHSYGADYAWGKHGLPFQDMPEIDSIEDITDSENESLLFDILDQRCSRGDTPLNLAATGLMANAYLFTGDEIYRDWIREYVEKWQERIETNDGIIPDNIGLSGDVGEYIDGKWYGGFYGWTWSGWHAIGAAVTIAAETITLLEGKEEYLDLLRSQIDVLLDNAIEENISNEKRKTLHIPHKYGDSGSYYFNPNNALRESDGEVRYEDGWFLFHPVTDPDYFMHLWHASMSEDDRDRLRQVRNYQKRDWEVLPLTLDEKYVGGHEFGWESYLAGEFPEYPEKILRLDYHQSHRRLMQINDDEQPPESYNDDYLQKRNPIVEEGLLQLTMGAPQPIYNGGLLRARIRHFDPERQRPGLPPDVAALVEELEPEKTVVHLVNTGAIQRDVLIQAGAYGEHEFTSIKNCTTTKREQNMTKTTVEDNCIHLSLPPKTRARLCLETKRYANNPSYAFPWMESLPAGIRN